MTVAAPLDRVCADDTSARDDWYREETIDRSALVSLKESQRVRLWSVEL